jgi:hypothetical protein
VIDQPPSLISQQGSPSDPTSDALEEAVLWDYSFTFYGGPPDARFAVTFNEERTIEYAIALEDVDGIAQVRVSSDAETLPVVLFADTELVPADDAYRYQTSDGAMLTFAEAEEPRSRTVVFRGLDVLSVQSARASVEETSFPSPFLPFIDNNESIEIGVTPAPLGAHIAALLQSLLESSPFAKQGLSLESHYSYSIGGVSVEAPVLLFMRQEVAIGFDEELIEQIASALQQWLDAVQPPTADAHLIFVLTLWNATPRTDAVLLRLGRVSLAMSAVSRAAA